MNETKNDKSVYLVFELRQDGTIYVLEEFKTQEEAQNLASKLNGKVAGSSSFGYTSG